MRTPRIESTKKPLISIVIDFFREKKEMNERKNIICVFEMRPFAN